MGVQAVRLFLENLYPMKIKAPAIAALAIAGAVSVLYLAHALRDGGAEGDGVPIVRLDAQGMVVASTETRPAAIPSDRPSLARALQTGLRKAECYDGPVNGLWTASSREAMRRFVGAVNAQLPVDDPDQFLLGLLQSNPNATCSPGADPAGTVATSSATAPIALPTKRPNPSAAGAVAPVARQVPEMADTLETGSNSAAAREWVSRDVLESSDDAKAAPAVVVPVRIEAEPIDRQPKDTTAVAQPQKSGSHRMRYARRQKPATLNGVSKSITKSFKSIQRSLAGIFN